MRPVNLIPPEQRGSGRPPTRTGILPYLVITVLVLALIGVVMTVFTENDISAAEAEVVRLEAELAQLNADAAELEPYVRFAEMSQGREITVRSLAESRFDWERVLQELALIIPDDVWLVDLTATVGPGVVIPDAASVGNRAAIDAPVIEMIGCAESQTAVARFLTSLEDIDGVTRVGLEAPERPEPTAGDQDPGAAGDDDCRTRGFIWRFGLLISFDAVAAPPGADTPPAVPPAGEGEQGSGETTTEGEQTTGETTTETEAQGETTDEG